MELLLAKTLHGLAPGDDEAKEQLRRLKLGQLVRCDVKRVRNGAHHRKMFALLNTVWQATGQWPTVDNLLTELKFRLGHTDEFLMVSTGEIFRIPRSISFSAMDQAEFESFYERALHELADMAGGIDDSVLRNSVLEQLH